MVFGIGEDIMGFNYSKIRNRNYPTKEDHPLWAGGVYTGENGRAYIKMSEHSRAKARTGYVSRSLLVVEKAMGKYLSKGHPIHHVDGNPSNDANNNLVVCESQGYHLMLDRRRRAFKACGHADWRKCPYCQKYDDLDNLIANGLGFTHRECKIEYGRKYRAKLKRKKEQQL